MSVTDSDARCQDGDTEPPKRRLRLLVGLALVAILGVFAVAICIQWPAHEHWVELGIELLALGLEVIRQVPR